MTPEERITLIRRTFDDLWNKGNLAVCDDLYASHCSFHDPNFTIDGVAGMKQQVTDLRTAQPDLHLDVQDVLIDGDLSAFRWTSGGTAQKEFRGLPPTGKSYVMTGMDMAKWEDDRIVEQWTNYDLLGALQQVGIIPELGAEASAEATEATEAKTN